MNEYLIPCFKKKSYINNTLRVFFQLHLIRRVNKLGVFKIIRTLKVNSGK